MLVAPCGTSSAARKPPSNLCSTPRLRRVDPMSSDTEAFAQLGPAEPGMELALLALALTDNAVLDRLGPLEADDFADPMHGVAFATMQELRSEGRAISLVTMQAKVGSVVFADGTGLLDAL